MFLILPPEHTQNLYLWRLKQQIQYLERYSVYGVASFCGIEANSVNKWTFSTISDIIDKKRSRLGTMEIECIDAVRYKIKYKGHNLYVIKSDVSLDINCLDHDKGKSAEQTTLTGLGIISGLITLALEEGVDEEIIASAIWQESRKQKDLADLLSLILVK